LGAGGFNPPARLFPGIGGGMSEQVDPDGNRVEGFALTVLFSALSVTLLACIGIATRWGPESAGWWTRPMLMPGIALSLLVAANIITLARDIADLRRNPPSMVERAEGRAKLLGWLQPIEFLAYYGIYVFVIQHAGYFPSTLIFILVLMFRVKLTTPRWIIAGLGAAVFMVAVFRMGLGVWMPAPALYEIFPDGVRSALIRWF
jgi:nitrate reductase gamma subunit